MQGKTEVLLDALKDAAMILDKKGFPLEVNGPGRALLKALEVGGASLFSRVGCDDVVLQEYLRENDDAGPLQREISLGHVDDAVHFVLTVRWVLDGEEKQLLAIFAPRARPGESASRLEKMNLYLGKLQNIARAGICCVTLSPHTVEWSDHLFQVLGYEVHGVSPSEELLYSHITEQDRARVSQAIARAEALHEGVTLQCGYVRAGGEPLVASIHFDTEWSAQKELLKRRYVFQDITKEHKRELLLSERERWFTTFFENDESIKLMIDPESGRIVDANAAAVAFYGHPRDSLCSCHIHDINQLSPSEVAQEMERARTHKRNYFQFRHRLRSGEIRDVEVYSTPITLKGRELLYSIVHDVTSREVAKRALIESEQRLKTFSEVAREAIIVHRDGVIADMNRSFERMFDVDASVLTGKPISALFTDPAAREVQGSLFSDSEGEPIEMSIQLPRGKYLHVEAVTRSVVWGDAVQKVTCIFDISMRKNMEEHLRQSQRLGAIGQLAGGVAHDFNNLLGAILGFTDISMNVLAEDHEVTAYLKKIKGAGKRAKELVAQILAFSRHEGSNRKVVNMKTVLEETVSFLRGSVPSTVRIAVMEPASNCAIRANPTEILQVLMNIATNAVQAMNDVGQLTIRGAEYEVKETTQGVLGELRAGRYGVFTIKDTGVGMDATILPNIFEPYFTTKPMGRGTGLGLSMVYGIIRSHKGNITVTSVKGVGTTFNLFFPLVPTTEYERVAEDAGPNIARGKGRVLLVDDEAALVEMGETILRLLGYSVTSTTSSSEALAILLEDPNQYDLLITDQTMPAMTGTELIESIRMVRPQMPVLLITGYNSRIDKGNAAAFGIDHFYMKPLEMHEFAQAVRAAMGTETGKDT